MTNGRVAIVSDSTSYIPEELVERFGLVIVPQILNWKGEGYLDGVEISNDAFYTRLAQSKELPATAQRSPRQFVEAFARLKEAAEAVFNHLARDIEPVEIYRAGLSPVVDTHAGPGAVGVAVFDTSSLQGQLQ